MRREWNDKKIYENSHKIILKCLNEIILLKGLLMREGNLND